VPTTLIVFANDKTLRVNGGLEEIHGALRMVRGNPVRLQRERGDEETPVYVNPAHVAYYEEEPVSAYESPPFVETIPT